MLVFSYYCNGSTIEPNPAEAICPIGNYCPEGSYKPTPCPRGTIAVGLGNSAPDDCDPCPPGQYCTPEMSKDGEEKKRGGWGEKGGG